LATRDSEARTGLVISLSCDDVLADLPPIVARTHPARQPKSHTLLWDCHAHPTRPAARSPRRP